MAFASDASGQLPRGGRGKPLVYTCNMQQMLREILYISCFRCATHNNVEKFHQSNFNIGSNAPHPDKHSHGGKQYHTFLIYLPIRTLDYALLVIVLSPSPEALTPFLVLERIWNTSKIPTWLFFTSWRKLESGNKSRPFSYMIKEPNAAKDIVRNSLYIMNGSGLSRPGTIFSPSI